MIKTHQQEKGRQNGAHSTTETDSLEECKAFMAKTLEEKTKWILQAGLCYRCLSLSWNGHEFNSWLVVGSDYELRPIQRLRLEGVALENKTSCGTGFQPISNDTACYVIREE